MVSDSPTPGVHEQVREQFQQAPLWYLATCQGGEPNVVPVGFKWIEGNTLLIADCFFRQTRANLEAHPKVAVSVGLLNPKRGFQIKARASVHRAGPVFERVCQLLRSAGYTSAPWAAIEIPMEQVYLLNPGGESGTRLV